MLKINGKKQKKYEKGKTRVHYIFKDVKLKTGKNKISATSGKYLKDDVVWYLTN
jgi:hypothetical protein